MAEQYEAGLYRQWLELRGITEFAAVVDTGDGDFGMDVRGRVLYDLIRYEFNNNLFHVSAARVVLGPHESVEVQDVAANPVEEKANHCLLYTSPSPRDQRGSRMPSSA